MEKVAIFDLDGTLINGDSTIEFIDYFLRKQKSKKNYIKFLINRVTNYFIPLSGIRNNYRYRCIKLLKGYNLESITLTAIEFVELFLSKIINDNILEQANKLKKQGFVTIILSGSIDIVVDAFARRYGFIQSKGSSLKFDAHNICEGVFERDISNSKIDIIKSLSNRIDFANSYSFTDNKVDSMWLKYFGHAYGVVNSYIDSDFWQQNNLNVLYKIPALRIKKEYLYWPLEYYWYTRLRLADYIPSFIIDYIILPIILITNQGFSLNIFYFISILISFLIFYSAYEIGYITNDQHAYKETKPTYRVPQWPSIFINKLILIRI
jgi:HAD superfamily phosphoserine phosphatase-like hydrolase